MALFESAIVQVATPGTISTKIWDPSNTSATTLGALGSVASGATLKDVTVINSGTVNIYVGMGSVSAASTTSLLVPVGGQMTLQGYSQVGTTGSPGAIWANVGTVGYTGATVAGLASVVSVT